AGGPVYCSFDIDCVDPAYAPATGTPEVGGLSSYEALAIVRGLQGLQLIGCDLVEVSPPYDGPGQITSLLAANLLFEFVSLLALAAHVAAMAPATNIGAAHPVAVGGGSLDKESMKKVENDAAAFARTIAATRGRNIEWAEKAVRQSVSATEREAVKLNIVDLVADSTTDLLDKIDGRRVKTPRGAVVLRTKGAVVQSIQIGFRDRILNVITDPNVAYVLMMLGMLGLFFELSITGAAGLIGLTGVARSPLDPEGQVRVLGELWRARADPGPVAEGETVRVVAVEGLTLKVVKAAP